MSIIVVLLSLLAAGSASLTIAAKLRQSKQLEYLFKPLTLTWIILIVVVAQDPPSPRYQLLILAGLLASLAGDAFLMLDQRHFLYGVLSFLIAHCFYFSAFAWQTDGLAPLYYAVPFVTYGGLMLWWLWPYLGPMRGPVTFYVVVILLMGWQAANRWLQVPGTPALLALAGAYLFIASDSVLAVERFRGSWRSAPFWVLSLYFAAQWLIALSV